MQQKGNPTDFLINFQTTGGLNKPLVDYLNTTLHQGPEYDNFTYTIYLKIIDDSGGVTICTIQAPVQVQPNTTHASMLLNEILNSDSNSQANKNLFGGDLRSALQTIASIAKILNSQSYSNKNSIRTIS